MRFVVSITASVLPAVKYHGLDRRYLTGSCFLMRPLLDGDTLAGRAMGVPRAILDLENRSVGAHGEPTLGRALELAAAEWRSGNRDRELCLHLLFLSWYCNIEPPHLTGFSRVAFDGDYFAGQVIVPGGY